MITVTLNVVKKNRVYFKCTNPNGYEVKLKITPASEALQPGEHDLLVNDISVRSKYGTDVIYELHSEIRDTGICTLRHRYNSMLVDQCRNLGGRWDKEQKAWVFSKVVEAEVEGLDELFNSDMVVVDITSLDAWGSKGPVDFLGYPIARATDRDSGAVICDDVAMISGYVTSGGSAKNWGTIARAGSVFRLMVSRKLLEKYEENDWTYEIKNEGTIS